MAQTDDPEQQRLQEEYMKALLSGTPQGQAGQGQGQQGGMPGEDDAMMKMMQAMLGGMNGGPNASNPGEMPFSPDDFSKMTGIPPFLTNMVMGGKQEAPPHPRADQPRSDVQDASDRHGRRDWRVHHIHGEQVRRDVRSKSACTGYAAEPVRHLLDGRTAGGRGQKRPLRPSGKAKWVETVDTARWGRCPRWCDRGLLARMVLLVERLYLIGPGQAHCKFKLLRRVRRLRRLPLA